MDRLIVHIGQDGGEMAARWALFRGVERVVASEQPLPLSAAFARLPPYGGPERRIVLLVPGAAATVDHVAVPPAQRRHRDRVLPFLMEEKLADDVALLHFSPLPEDEAGRTAVVVVKKSRLRGWLDALRAAGIEPHIVLPDMLALPSPATGEWCALCGDGQVWLRHGLSGGAMLDEAVFSLMAVSLLKAAPAPARMQWLIPPNAAAFSPPLAVKHIPFDTQEYDGSVFDVLCRGYLEQATTVNLLHGDFAPPSTQDRQKYTLNAMAKISAALFLGAVLLEWGQGAYFSHRAATLRRQTVAVYQNLFPADTRIVDPVQQTKNHLKADPTAGSGFLALLESTAARIGADQPLDLDSLTYSDDSHKLTLTINAHDLESLNAVARRVDGGPLDAHLVSVNKEQDAVRAQLAVERK